MLDQSFSLSNFRTIFEIENRKGGFERNFFSKEYLDKTQEIADLKIDIEYYIPVEEEDPFLFLLLQNLSVLLKEKEQILDKDLLVFSQEINAIDFGLNLKKFLDADTGKTVYTVEKNQTSFFTMKQLQYNINRSFSVKQSNRYEIVKQVKKILQDNFEKYIVRTDIESFYESVPQKRLMEIIHGNQLLSPKSKKLIGNLIYHFNSLSGELHKPLEERVGVPRGAGVSAYLAELYMRTIDERIRQLPDLIYYGRYVDDIIAIFSPLKKSGANSFLRKVDAIVKEQGLKLKRGTHGTVNKTYEIDAFSSGSLSQFEFLGYRFDLIGKRYVGIYLSTNKMEKYKYRLEATFDTFIKDSAFNYSNAKRLLIHRLNYLTKNTHLQKPKKGIIGIYYSNSLLEKDSICLDLLNVSMYELIDAKFPLAAHPKLNQRLKRFCFRRGFVQRLFFNIASRRSTPVGSRGKNIPDMRSRLQKRQKMSINNF